MKRTISNRDDIIDSRDIIERIAELHSEYSDLYFEVKHADITEEERDTARAALAEWEEENGEEFSALKSLADQAEGYAGDWRYGATLIRDTYFEDYARELAEDIGAIKRDMGWPYTCIDWEQAAEELQQDYTSVDFAGVDYWVRS